jgi:hypothetical protein
MPKSKKVELTGWKKLLHLFVGYGIAFSGPTLVACLVATTSISILWCLVITPALATLSYYYERRGKP